MAKRKDIESILEDESLDIKAKVTRLLDMVHTEVDSIRDERDQMQTDLESAKADLVKANSAKEKAESDLTNYRNEQSAKETKVAKENALKGILQNLGIADKRISTVIKASDLNGIELQKDGTIKDADKLTESLKTEWADFIPAHQTQGANVDNPPKGNNSGSITKEQFAKMGYQARLNLFNEQPELYNELSKE